jgi:hypothetical protein
MAIWPFFKVASCVLGCPLLRDICGQSKVSGCRVEEEEYERNCRGTGKGNQFFGGLISLTVVDADDSLLAADITLSALAICAAATVACLAWTA